MDIYKYSIDDLRNVINKAKSEYKDSKIVNIPFKEWRRRKSIALMENGELLNVNRIKKGEVRYASTKYLLERYSIYQEQIDKLKEEMLSDISKTIENTNKINNLLKEAFIPEKVFEYDGFVEIEEEKCWFNSTEKGVCLRIGPESFDMSKPTGITLNDDNVHANIQGVTGCGKSVTMHDMIANISDEYPPWELTLILIDAKKIEMSFYSGTITLPHCDVISCTSSIDYNVDIIKEFASECEKRYKMLLAGGCSNLKDFRRKFNLVIPRTVFVVDEYLQFVTDIKNTEIKFGNKKVGDSLQIMNSGLAMLATQGRAAGLHLLISSQDLNTVLHESIASQMQAGLVMQSTVSMSQHSIGNKNGNKIDRKGICIINNRRLSESNEQYNQTVGIPFLKTEISDTSELSYFQKLIKTKEELYKKFGFSTKCVTYNEDSKVTPNEYIKELNLSVNNVKSNRNDIMYDLPMGKLISYTDPTIKHLVIECKKSSNILVNSVNPEILKYIFKYLNKVFKDEECSKQIAFYFNGPILKQTGIDEIDDIEKIRAKSILKTIPENILKRKQVLEIDSLALDTYENHSIVSIMKSICNYFDFGSSYTNEYLDKLKRLFELYSNGDDDVLNVGEVKDDENIHFLFHMTAVIMNIRNVNNLSDSETIEPYMFEKIVIYWLDVQDADDIQDGKAIDELNWYLQNSTTLNVLNVFNSNRWMQLQKYAKFFRYSIEYSTQSYYEDLGFSNYYCNCNANSITLHDILRSTKQPLKIFGGI